MSWSGLLIQHVPQASLVQSHFPGRPHAVPQGDAEHRLERRSDISFLQVFRVLIALQRRPVPGFVLEVLAEVVSVAT